ncbi:MAG: ATP-binding cassette domain-containing protein [Acidimicrobiales bacterium]
MSNLSAPRVIAQLVRNEPISYTIALLQWSGFYLSPLAVGYLLKLVLDRLDVADPGVPIMLLVGIIGLEVGRWALLWSAAVQWHGAWVGWQTVPRVNMLSSLATRSGSTAHRLPGSPGEAVSRFRDDTQDLAQVLDVWLDVVGSLLAASVALAVMASIDPLAATATVVPVGIALVASALLGPTLRAWRRAAREATGTVTSFIGDTFGSILAVKTAAAEDAVERRFAELNAKRAIVARRDQIGSEIIRSLGYGTGEVTIGVVLLIVAAAFRRGDLSVGDIGLFAAYVPIVAGLPKWIGRMGAIHRQADVSVDRLAELMSDRHRRSALRPTTTYLRHGPPAFDPVSPDTDDPIAVDTDRLDRLQVLSLTVEHDTAGHGIHDIDLDVRGGELVVVTGQVGAGKSTLLRGLLGLVEPSAGTIAWNGGQLHDPSEFLVPPRVAYLPQVPRLFSESLADTILLGLPDDELHHALWLACLDDDLVHMEHGADTIIGPRGLRLSGGQVQRTGAARALVRRPQLLVVDDLSSALDVETETRLWDRLHSDTRSAVLMVSHRPRILAMADQVITLEGGRRIG